MDTKPVHLPQQLYRHLSQDLRSIRTGHIHKPSGLELLLNGRTYGEYLVLGLPYARR
jgi:hypothetical protein